MSTNYALRDPATWERFSEALVEATENLAFVPLAGIPTHVIDAVKAAQDQGAFGVADFTPVDAHLIKASDITFNARALLQFRRADVPFFAIAAKNLYIEIPATRDEVAKIHRPGNAAFGDLTGDRGADGSIGSSSRPQENGASGGEGQPGKQGGTGRTASIPDLYIFFESLITTTGNPAASGLLQISVSGVPGGNGGTGGAGGKGGDGARGESSSGDGVICHAGPGGGGNGGRGGPGGQGGNAGKGGNGGNVFLVGPAGALEKAKFFEIRQEPGEPGQPGGPGSPGEGGEPGGGGQISAPCNGRGPGQPGGHPAPPNLGPGAQSGKGGRGIRAHVDRANTDLF